MASHTARRCFLNCPKAAAQKEFKRLSSHHQLSTHAVFVTFSWLSSHHMLIVLKLMAIQPPHARGVMAIQPPHHIKYFETHMAIQPPLARGVMAFQPPHAYCFETYGYPATTCKVFMAIQPPHDTCTLIMAIQPPPMLWLVPATTQPRTAAFFLHSSALQSIQLHLQLLLLLQHNFQVPTLLQLGHQLFSCLGVLLQILWNSCPTPFATHATAVVFL